MSLSSRNYEVVVWGATGECHNLALLSNSRKAYGQSRLRPALQDLSAS